MPKMFSNFIYFLVALVLYCTCDDPGSDASMLDHGLIIALVMVCVYWFLFAGFFFFRLAQERMEELEPYPECSSGWIIAMDKLLYPPFHGCPGCLFALDLYLLRLNLSPGWGAQAF